MYQTIECNSSIKHCASIQKTKKNKSIYSKSQKAKMWDAFDNAIDDTKTETIASVNTSSEIIECEVCHLCESILMIAENGLGARDSLDENGNYNDEERQQYLDDHLLAISEAIKDGCEVLAYTWWGIMDIVSAGTGEMEKRYGFIHVDVDNEGNGSFKRSKKESFNHYKQIIETNGASLHA